MNERINKLAKELAEVHIGDNDELGKIARELHGLIESKTDIGEIGMRASAIKLLLHAGEKQAIINECNRIIEICEKVE